MIKLASISSNDIEPKNAKHNAIAVMRIRKGDAVLCSDLPTPTSSLNVFLK